MLRSHKLKLMNVNGAMRIATMDGGLISSVIRLDVTSEINEITTATILVELHDDDGMKSIFRGANHDIKQGNK